MTLSAAAPDLALLEQESCAEGVKTELRDAILAKFRAVAADQEKTIAPLTDDLVLLESGLDSLCFAIIVATLEDELGYDPFTEAEDVFFPVTLGDFVRFYERAR
jgi:acyl carrier protein